MSRSTRLARIATAAWRANTEASSTSRRLNAADARLSSTSRTPIVPPSSTSGTATIERGTYPVDWAKARPNRESFSTSESAIACPVW